MELPQREQAFVPGEKIRDYLLSLTHPVGRAKAKFFRGLGYDETNMDLLEAELLRIARTEPVMRVDPTSFGTKYMIEGVLAMQPAGAATIRTVWIIETGLSTPRFVTAYPAD